MIESIGIVEIFGYVGSALVSVNLFPQIVKIIKKKSAKNISYSSIGINILASIFMLIYSVKKMLIPIIISNCVIFLSSMIIVYLKQYYTLIVKELDNDVEISANTCDIV